MGTPEIRCWQDQVQQLLCDARHPLLDHIRDSDSPEHEKRALELVELALDFLSVPDMKRTREYYDGIHKDMMRLQSQLVELVPEVDAVYPVSVIHELLKRLGVEGEFGESVDRKMLTETLAAIANELGENK